MLSEGIHKTHKLCTGFATFLYTPKLFQNKKLKQKRICKCPSTDEWIKKMWHIYVVEYYSAIKRNEIICSEVDGPRVCHTE